MHNHIDLDENIVGIQQVADNGVVVVDSLVETGNVVVVVVVVVGIDANNVVVEVHKHVGRTPVVVARVARYVGKTPVGVAAGVAAQNHLATQEYNQEGRMNLCSPCFFNLL